MRYQKDFDTYSDRKKSKIVIELIDEAHVTRKYVADQLKISLQYFNNKLNRNSFSFEEMIKIADACGYEVRMVSHGHYPISVNELI